LNGTVTDKRCSNINHTGRWDAWNIGFTSASFFICGKDSVYRLIKAKQEAEREAAAETKKLQEDAIQAAEKAAEAEERARQKAQEDREKEAEKIAENARREIQRVEDIVKAERERLELQKIEKEQGKEAAAVQQFINQGVDEAQLQAVDHLLPKLRGRFRKSLGQSQNRQTRQGNEEDFSDPASPDDALTDGR
jgi:membrane protein involved in colicin uptake